MTHHKLASIALASIGLSAMPQSQAHAVMLKGTAKAGTFSFIRLAARPHGDDHR